MTPSAYSLHATALRELGRCQEATAEYAIAMSLTAKDSLEYINLIVQLCDTALEMGDNQRAIAEAQAGLSITGVNDLAPLRYRLFCALTANGEHGKAPTLYDEIIHAAPRADKELGLWLIKYVSDRLQAGRSWHPGDCTPAGTAFKPMIEAEERYRSLSAKGHRVITEGFNADWSPDGKKLVFSLGVRGRSGIAIYDPATKDTELLIVPGHDPKWSPDGQYIVFVRNRLVLRPEELATGERGDQRRTPIDDEIWIMKSDGTEPRRLARGGWPSWSQDATRVYYHSRADNTLCSISIEGQDAQPKRLTACSDPCPSVSPDGQWVAYSYPASQSLKVKELTFQALVAEWPVPFPTSGVGPSWSPTGRELCLPGRGTGLWIYRFDSSEPMRILRGYVKAASWAANRTKFVFCLGQPYFDSWSTDFEEIWTAILTPMSPS